MRDPGDGKSGQAGPQENGAGPLSSGSSCLDSVCICVLFCGFSSDFLGFPVLSGCISILHQDTAVIDIFTLSFSSGSQAKGST